MKKVLSLLLAAVMVFSLAVPSFASFSKRSEYPIIFLQGNGEDIVDEDGNVVYDFSYDTSNLANDIVEICMPNLLIGLSTGDYSAYYDSLYNKLSEVYGNAKLDVDGEVLAGTNVAPYRLQQNENVAKRGWASTYGMYEYHFWYDWRIDPLELADRLDDFINKILANSGKAKVSIYGRCIGGTPIIAYLAKYGSEKIDTVCLDAVVTNGCEMIGDTFTGNINLDTDAILRFSDGYFNENIRDVLGGDALIYDVLFSTVKMLNSLGVSNEILQLFMDTIFAQVGEGFISSFTRAGYATWPSYWTMVKADEFEKAKTVIFGDEDSELRVTYAGLIAKLDRYHDEVTSRMPEILKAAKESGTKFCIISKYGSQLFPYVNSYNEISDQWTTIGNASFGATACLIGETLSEEYIEQRTQEGLGRYISVDKQIDASTCALPDNTWIIKGMNHDEWEYCTENLAYAVCSNEIADIYSDPDYPQYLCYDKETSTLSPLTEENMNCEDYYGVDTGTTEDLSRKDSLLKKLKSLFEFLSNFLKFVKRLFENRQETVTAIR